MTLFIVLVLVGAHVGAACWSYRRGFDDGRLRGRAEVLWENRQ